MTNFQRAAIAAAASLLTLGAQAATLLSTSFVDLGDKLTAEAISTSFSAASGAGTLDFQLQGYRTLDGDNYWIDIFHLAVNGSEIFSGTFDLGGGGADRVLSSSFGATVTRIGEKEVAISTPIALLAGSNTISFSFDSPTVFEGTPRAGFQPRWDESWGVNQVVVTSAVPEPSSYALLLAGLGAIGLTVVRKVRKHD